MLRFKLYSWAATFLALQGFSQVALSQASVPTGTFNAAIDSERRYFEKSAFVRVDGLDLFRIHGIETFPADKRAEVIEQRILDAAKDSTLSVDSLTVRETEYSTDIYIGDRKLLSVFQIDADPQGVSREVLAHAFVLRIREIVTKYRADRQPEALRKNAVYAGGATMAALVFGLSFFWFFRWAGRAAERRFKERIHALKVGSFEVVRAERLWGFVKGLSRLLRFLFFLGLFYFYAEFVLRRFPWTRGFANSMLEWVTDPLRVIGSEIVAYLPKLAFLLVLGLAVFYALKLIKIFFHGVEHGAVSLPGFDPDWAKPTFDIVRIMVVAFALVVAYPYIPGSETAAFKGISIFLGVIVSLGSTSAVSSIIAGYTIIYRRAFKLGDRIQVGEYLGDVIHKTLLATYLRTLKHETVVVPNSLILGSNLVNYSTLATTENLILHTTVGIGYETPWRQVEAMLLQAAERTSNILRKPEPFVLQKSLGDFAITYEINVYCDKPREMIRIYTDLHRNILDVFNEHGVQIMTPAYVADPAIAKWVPKERWFEPPAKGQGE